MHQYMLASEYFSALQTACLLKADVFPCNPPTPRLPGYWNRSAVIGSGYFRFIKRFHYD